MISKRIMIILSVIVFLLLLTGCNGGDTSESISLNDPYLGGSQGLVIEFEPLGVETNGVQQIFDDETFPVEFTLKNKGEYTVPAGTLKTKIKGISPSDYTGLTFEKSNSDEIEKISEYNDRGGETTIDHGDGRLVASRIKDRNLLSATIFGEITYPYKTFISAPKVCFKDVTSKTRDNEICDVDTTLQVFSSGAPIKAVSAQESRSGRGLVAVEFEIENVGGGEAKSASSAEFDYRYDEIGFNVQESSSPEKWDCRSSGREGVGRFGDDQRLTIICKLRDQYKIQPDEVYQSQLDLTLEYSYKVLISSDLIIRNNDI
ncbi:hypothetical protein GOV08_02355 [Candidatus Woesearchaeota archaeon]|nr:hypothetical protein [Candidatus Woesearchaeota archaeon]